MKPTTPKANTVMVLNLDEDKELHFDSATDPAHAVQYAQAVETLHLASWFFNNLHAAINGDAHARAQIDARLPVRRYNVQGRSYIACGDWTARDR